MKEKRKAFDKKNDEQINEVNTQIAQLQSDVHADNAKTETKIKHYTEIEGLPPLLTYTVMKQYY